MPNKILDTIYNITGVFDKVSSEFTEDRNFDYINGQKIKISSKRMATIKASPKCACCGLAVRFAKIEQSGKDSPHLNFYGMDIIDNGGEEVLFTRDHIVPFSHTQDDSKENSQTMCIICNNLKGNKFLSNEELLELRKKYNKLRSEKINHGKAISLIAKA